MILEITLITVLFVLCFTYLNGKCNELYWKKRKVAFYSKIKVTSVFWKYMTGEKAIFENLWEVYKLYRDEPAVGIGAFLTPTLYVIDPKNVHHVLVSDFASFNHRGVSISANDVLGDNILFMHGNRWKLMRNKMSPLFTSTKLKSMFYIIDKSAADFVEHLKRNENLRKGGAFNTLSSFCSAALGAAVFGVTTKSIFDSPFLDMAQEAFMSSCKRTIKFAANNLCNPLFNFLGIKLFQEYEDLIIGAVKKVIRAREKENVKKHDFADICVYLQSMGKMVDHDTGLELQPTDELLAAQAFFFFTAGVEPVATVIFNTLVQMGLHPQYMDRINDEIEQAFRVNGTMDYDVLNGMTYLDMVVNESMRLLPPVGYVTRKCVNDTVLPFGNIRVSKGTKIFVPIFELHRDERYYSEPDVFNPERFSAENKHSVSDATYLPFGRGARLCLGSRYGALQAKAGIVYLLRNFTVRTIVLDEAVKYSRQQFQVRLSNYDLEFIPKYQ